jgi:hypothetical protein
VLKTTAVMELEVVSEPEAAVVRTVVAVLGLKATAESTVMLESKGLNGA